MQKKATRKNLLQTLMLKIMKLMKQEFRRKIINLRIILMAVQKFQDRKLSLKLKTSLILMLKHRMHTAKHTKPLQMNSKKQNTLLMTDIMKSHKIYRIKNKMNQKIHLHMKMHKKKILIAGVHKMLFKHQMSKIILQLPDLKYQPQTTKLLQIEDQLNQIGKIASEVQIRKIKKIDLFQLKVMILQPE